MVTVVLAEDSRFLLLHHCYLLSILHTPICIRNIDKLLVPVDAKCTLEIGHNFYRKSIIATLRKTHDT